MTSFTDWYEADELSAREKFAAFDQMNDAKVNAAEARELDATAARNERRTESLTFALRQSGISLEELHRSRLSLQAAEDELAERSAELAKAQAKVDRKRSAVEFIDGKVAEATTLAHRSASFDLLGPAREALAEVRAQASAQRVDAMLTAGRPKAAAGYAVRSDAAPVCQGCQDAGVRDADEEYRLHAQMAVNAAGAARIQDLRPYDVPAQRKEGRQAMIHR